MKAIKNRMITAGAVLSLVFLAGCGGSGDSTGPSQGLSAFNPSGGTPRALTKPISLSGAIFTTTVDGSIVNENVHYEAKEDVYLDGGPGPNAPVGAAGLPEGDYYFQVTDPSGKDLLSTDHISCRSFHVNAAGVIDVVHGGTNLEKQQGTWTSVPCQHNEGVDIDHAADGAITVQLFPYDDTPNNGGVYKVWITRVGDYVGILPQCEGNTGQCNVNGENWAPANVHGFIPSRSKTDNYKVLKKGGKPCDPGMITVAKFHDANANGVQDAGEEDITGWPVDVTDPTGVTNTVFTPETILAAVAGDYLFEEAELPGTQATTPTSVTVTIFDECAGEGGAVVFGNVGLGSVTACKVYDRDGDGIADGDEPPVEGFRIELSQGGVVLQTGETGADGCVTFGDLEPGTYTVTELLPAGWVATGPTSVEVVITSNSDGTSITGTAENVDFTNRCEAVGVGFSTKGYWHNKNGLDEMVQSDIDFANTLDPYDSETTYFGNGDEPFDGVFTDGTPVDAAFNNDDLSGAVSAGVGTPKAEVSHFLVDNNAGSSENHHVEQLAQQLLAFIFNVRHRLDNPDAAIQLPDGSFISASDLINQAVAVWTSDDAADATVMSGLLDTLNNSHCDDIDPCVLTIPFNPCPVVY